MYNLLMFSKTEVKYLEKISAKDVIKAIKLFCERNRDADVHLYEYSCFADNEDDYYRVLHLFR